MGKGFHMDLASDRRSLSMLSKKLRDNLLLFLENVVDSLSQSYIFCAEFSKSDDTIGNGKSLRVALSELYVKVEKREREVVVLSLQLDHA
jgi:hypothetical protein